MWNNGGESLGRRWSSTHHSSLIGRSDKKCEKMNLVGQVLFAILAFSFASAAEPNANSQPLVDIQNLRNSLSTKTENVGRLFRLFSSGSKSDDEPKDEPSRFPFIARSFRRLNIFGLQAPPDEPTKSFDGKISEKEKIPDILRVTNRPDVEDAPNFSVVQPQRNFNEKSTAFEQHYPKLNIEGLLREEQQPEPTQPNFYQVYESSYQPQLYQYVQQYWFADSTSINWLSMNVFLYQ